MGRAIYVRGLVETKSAFEGEFDSIEKDVACLVEHGFSFLFINVESTILLVLSSLERVLDFFYLCSINIRYGIVFLFNLEYWKIHFLKSLFRIKTEII